MDDFIHPKTLLRTANIRPRRRWGQNFLCQPSLVEKIVDLVPPAVHVVEIGAGVGSVTRELLKRGYPVTAIEIDPLLVELLHREFAHFPQLTIINADVLTLSISDLQPAGMPLVVAGNLPYYITTPIMLHLLEAADLIQRAVIMVQKEVGDRLLAQPGTSDYGILSVFNQYRTHSKIQFQVKPTAFYPSPKISSVVMTLDFTSPQIPVANETLFFRLIRAAFAQRRKMIRNTLKNLDVPDDVIQRAFIESGIDHRRRGETLSLVEFACLTQQIDLFS